MEELQQALFYDCGGPVKNVNYIDVFQDDHEGNQGKFVEAMRDQYLEESRQCSIFCQREAVVCLGGCAF